MNCYVDDTLGYVDNISFSTTSFYLSSSGQCFDKDGMCPAPLDVEVDSNGSLPDTVSVVVAVHNPQHQHAFV